MCFDHVSWWSKHKPRNWASGENSNFLSPNVSFGRYFVVLYLRLKTTTFVLSVDILKPHSLHQLWIIINACCSILIAAFGLRVHFHIAESSANCDKSMGSASSASYSVLIIRLHNIGDKTAPFRHSLRSDNTVPSLTWILRPVTKFCIQSSIFPSMPYSTSFCSTPFLHMRSKAFSRSRNTAQHDLRRSRAVLMADVSRRIWSIVDLFFLKPDCVFPKSFFCSMNVTSLLAAIVSITLPMADVSDIGL